MAGAVINVQPVCVFKMEDEAGAEEEVIAVRMPKLTLLAMWPCCGELNGFTGSHAAADPAFLGNTVRISNPASEGELWSSGGMWQKV